MVNREIKTPTIRDVAKLAGVSQSTTSRALTRRGYASQEVRERVLQAANQLGYKPHALASSLRKQTTQTIGLLIGDIINPFYAHLADGVLDGAQEMGFHVILSAHAENPAEEQSSLEVLIQQRVAGIVAVPTGQNIDLWGKAQDLGIHLVMVDRKIKSLNNIDNFLIDNVSGAYDLTSYLIHLGHRRIGIIIGPPITTTGEGRLKGYQEALRKAGIPVEDELVLMSTFQRSSGRQAAQDLLALKDPPTAIFAANNILGEACLFAIREKGLRIPEDISLGIFDDVPWASLTAPSVTAVSQPAYRLGKLSVKRLIQRLQNEGDLDETSGRGGLTPELIIRGSCKAISNSYQF